MLNHANLECLKESPQNPGDWDLKPWNLFCHGILYPTRGLCCILLLLFGQRWEDSVLPSRLMGRQVAKWVCYKALLQALVNLSFMHWTQVSPKIILLQFVRFLVEWSNDFKWDLEVKLWDHKLTSQTVSLMVKPWALEGLC